MSGISGLTDKVSFPPKMGGSFCRLDTGYTYSGDINTESQRDGEGILIYPNGSVYKGSWESDLRHGHGRFTSDPNNAPTDGYEIEYVGEWMRGMREGQGKLTIKEEGGQRVYEGGWLGGRMHGESLPSCACCGVLCIAFEMSCAVCVWQERVLLYCRTETPSAGACGGGS